MHESTEDTSGVHHIPDYIMGKSQKLKSSHHLSNRKKNKKERTQRNLHAFNVLGKDKRTAHCTNSFGNIIDIRIHVHHTFRGIYILYFNRRTKSVQSASNPGEYLIYIGPHVACEENV